MTQHRLLLFAALFLLALLTTAQAQVKKLTISASVATAVEAAPGTNPPADQQEKANVLVSVLDESGEGVNGLKEKDFSVFVYTCTKPNCGLVPMTVTKVVPEDLCSGCYGVLLQNDPLQFLTSIGSPGSHSVVIRVTQTRLLFGTVGGPPTFILLAQGQQVISYVLPR